MTNRILQGADSYLSRLAGIKGKQLRSRHLRRKKKKTVRDSVSRRS
jgi:hypothetical protein